MMRPPRTTRTPGRFSMLIGDAYYPLAAEESSLRAHSFQHFTWSFTTLSRDREGRGRAARAPPADGPRPSRCRPLSAAAHRACCSSSCAGCGRGGCAVKPGCGKPAGGFPRLRAQDGTRRASCSRVQAGRAQEPEATRPQRRESRRGGASPRARQRPDNPYGRRRRSVVRLGIISAYPDEDWHARQILEEARRVASAEVLSPLDFSAESGDGGARLLVRGEPHLAWNAFLTPRAIGDTGDHELQLELYRTLAEEGAVMINDVQALTVAIDKFKTGWLLARAGLPTPPALVTQQLGQALAALDRFGGRAVAKPLYGSPRHRRGAAGGRQAAGGGPDGGAARRARRALPAGVGGRRRGATCGPSWWAIAWRASSSGWRRRGSSAPTCTSAAACARRVSAGRRSGCAGGSACAGARLCRGRPVRDGERSHGDRGERHAAVPRSPGGHRPRHGQADRGPCAGARTRRALGRYATPAGLRLACSGRRRRVKEIADGEKGVGRKGNMTVQEAGRKGASEAVARAARPRATAMDTGSTRRFGKKGGSRVRDLIEAGKKTAR